MNTPHVIIGAGFGGLKVARQLRNAPVQITLIDKQKISSRSRSQSDYKQVIHRIIPMKNLLKLEELFLFGLSLFLFSRLDYSWGWYALLFLTPDLSALGYLINPRVGSWTYNLIHHKG
ncbi:MAG TPA: DUF4260 family protein, partial [Anaerolineales bacterium]|nr:DUF4260 family protein [Anaerolineales bacterium]